MTNIGKNIRYLRKSKKMSQYDLAQILNKSESAIQMWETGYRTPTMGTVQELSNTFGVAINDLVNTNLETAHIKQTIRFDAPCVQLPLYQDISCGKGSFIEDNAIDYITIPENMLKKGKEYFACYSKGDSMIDENINDGDLVIFEKTSIINNGEIGCFCIDDNQATCKRFRKDTRTGMIMLLPANNDYEPIMVTLENQNFRVIGKLALVINNRQK